VAHIEVATGIVILAFLDIVVQDPAVEVEWAFQSRAWTIVVTHVVYGVENLVTHVPLLFAV
jgi:hypothetical protein